MRGDYRFRMGQNVRGLQVWNGTQCEGITGLEWDTMQGDYRFRMGHNARGLQVYITGTPIE